jgi:DNA primase
LQEWVYFVRDSSIDFFEALLENADAAGHALHLRRTQFSIRRNQPSRKKLAAMGIGDGVYAQVGLSAAYVPAGNVGTPLRENTW